MHVSIVTVFPDLYTSFLSTSILSRAVARGLVRFNIVAFTDYCGLKERIDEPTCGPGPGMVLKPDVVGRAIDDCKKKHGDGFVVFFSPQGRQLTQDAVKAIYAELSVAKAVRTDKNASRDDQAAVYKHLILVCPRYEGVDPRVEDFYADILLSIGDYVLMGGDLPAQVFLEALLRYVPGVVGKEASVTEDSFSGPTFDYPTYGLPKVWKERSVPEIVFSGNHQAIDAWRRDRAYAKTVVERFDWLRRHVSDDSQRALAADHIPKHFVALMHTEVYLKGGRVGTTSIKSIDLHDISRACATYGIERFYPVTPLVDQRYMLDTFLAFWRSDEGARYNPHRLSAVDRIVAHDNFDAVVNAIVTETGQLPYVIATSARMPTAQTMEKMIDYTDHAKVWSQKKPVLFLFGTGYGLSKELVARADAILLPVRGFSPYNHLSVRSAVAIVLDRWLGVYDAKNSFELENSKK